MGFYDLQSVKLFMNVCNVDKSWDISQDFSNQGLTDIVKRRPFILTCLHQRKKNRHG